MCCVSHAGSVPETAGSPLSVISVSVKFACAAWHVRHGQARGGMEYGNECCCASGPACLARTLLWPGYFGTPICCALEVPEALIKASNNAC